LIYENVDFGKTVTDGIYHKDHLQRIPAHLFTKYFNPANKDNYFMVNDDLKNLITFKKCYDLLSLKPLRNDYSLVICKNVLLHFNQQQRINVIQFFCDALLTGGLLAMENTQTMPQELHQKFIKKVDYAQLTKKFKAS
jgi:chemotaxis protein methyltransferase CheR